MITSLEHAHAVQQRRVDSGRTGYARAVRTFLKNQYTDTYQEELKKLPVKWNPAPEQATA